VNKTALTFGGWYQRTTLHLSEIYSLLALGHSKLPLDKNKLAEFHQKLNLKKVTREADYLEYVKAITKDGIEIRYYEDGLYVLEIETEDIDKGKEKLSDYFEQVFNPAINYIFSLGAPTPKILANIETSHPTVITINQTTNNFKIDKGKFGEVYSQITAEGVTVFKTPKHIFVSSSKKEKNTIQQIVEMQIFFREFKDQLEKYLDIHRLIWEKIADIKERQQIKGGQVVLLRTQLEAYRKTIQLINNRINQMGAYINTRAAIAKNLKIEKYLVELFQFKFEILNNTLSYIKEIWQMTQDYLESAIDIIKEIEGKSTRNSIRSLQLITTVGIISGILGYLAQDKLPKISSSGVVYFLLLISLTAVINGAIAVIYRNSKYRIKLTERAKRL